MLKDIFLLPYIVILFSIVLLTCIDKKHYDSYVFFIVCFILLIFSSFRYGGFGTGDYFNYLQFSRMVVLFDNVVNQNIPAEIGFRFIAYMSNYLYLPVNSVIVLMGILSLIPVLYIIYKYSQYKILSLLILLPYFFTMNMQSSRTSVAAGMGLLFIMFCYEKKYMKASLSFLLALSFHELSGALVFISLTILPIYILLILFFFIALFVALFNPISFIAKAISISGFSAVSNKIISYQQSEIFGHALKLYDPRAILTFLVILLFAINVKNMNQSINVFLGKVFIIGGIVMFLFSPLVIISWRVSYLFLLSGIIFIPNICFMYNMQIYSQLKVKRVMNTFFCFIYVVYCLGLIFKAQEYSFILWPTESVR